VPPNPTCLIQSTDWSAIATLKQYYFRRVHSQAIRATDREGGPTPKKLWKECNIWNTVNNTGNSLAETNKSKMHGCWKSLCTDLA